MTEKIQNAELTGMRKIASRRAELTYRRADGTMLAIEVYEESGGTVPVWQFDPPLDLDTDVAIRPSLQAASGFLDLVDAYDAWCRGEHLGD
jgi:hypothetical protein